MYVYSRAIVYKRQNFLKIVVHMVTIDRALDEIQHCSCRCDVRVLLIEGYL